MDQENKTEENQFIEEGISYSFTCQDCGCHKLLIICIEVKPEYYLIRLFCHKCGKENLYRLAKIQGQDFPEPEQQKKKEVSYLG